MSGNYLYFDERVDGFECEDCGYPLVESAVFDTRRCLFCRCERFYLQWPLLLWFLGPKPVCYLCEATYKGTKISSPDQKFRQEVEDAVKQSECAVRWKTRAEQWQRDRDEELAAESSCRMEN